MHTLRQYLTSLSDPHGVLRTLREIELCCTAQGKPIYSVGNTAAVFKIRHKGHLKALRCYLREAVNLPIIYREGFYPRELYLYSDSATAGEWVDVVLSDWIEGVDLRQAIEQAAAERDRAALQALADRFDRFAVELLAADSAHGDLKPENLIVTADGVICSIDRDAMFLPQFAGSPSLELGTAAYQHPRRTTADFGAYLDDYPVALIATALRALSLDPELLMRYADCDGLLFSPQHLAADRAYKEVLELFSQHNQAAAYRIAQLLTAPTPQLFGLKALLEAAVRVSQPPTTTPELYVENGRWGYRTADEVVIAPLYDAGFEFSEGLAAVALGRTWHYIDPVGRAVISCPEAEAVKPFRGGRAQVVCGDSRYEIDKSGRRI